MNTEKRDKFTRLWARFFNNSELPIIFQYSADSREIPILEAPQGHRCIIAQLLKVRRGESLCMVPSSVSCVGGKRYMMYTDSMPQKFECYISHYPDGKGERYKIQPEQVNQYGSFCP